jgi:hypothetical protein
MQKKRFFATALLAGSLVIGSVPALARDHHDKCEEKVRKAEQKLQNAQRKHGEHSRQAEQKRQELERARAHCGEHR